MVGTVPGIIPKSALVASRAVYYPFTVPQKLNDSATLTGAALNGMVKGINASVGNAYMALEPRGPAKWLVGLFDRTDKATTRSEEIAVRNKTVFWDPFSQGVEQVGRALASPGTYYYLKKAGVEQPTQDAIKAVLQMPFFKFPDASEVPAPAPPAEEAPPEEAPPTEAPPTEAPPTDAPPAEAPPAEAPPADAAAAAEGAAEGAGAVAA